MSRALIFGIAMLASRVAMAELGPMPGEERFQAITGGAGQSSGGAQLGFGQIGEDYFLKVTPRLDLNLGQIGLGLQVPLNLRVVDEDPENNDDFYGAIREEDWDETSEYFKVLRYVRWGHKGDALHVRVGELAGEIGHGTILGRYLNNIDVNTLRVGLQLDVNTNYGGAETLISNLGSIADTASPDSRLVGARLYLKPLAFIMEPDSTLNMVQVGTSVVTDQNAPFELETDEGDPADPSDDRIALDNDGNFAVARTRAATVYGFDVAVELLRTPILDLTPYTDLNFISHAGWGWHLGVQAVAKMPIGFDLTIPARLEYRRFRQDYLPTYFDTFYEIERYAFPASGPVAAISPKNRLVRLADEGDGINGYYGDLAFDFAGILRLGAVYEDYDHSPGPFLSGYLAVPALESLQFKAYYARNGITGTDDIFKLDERSLLVAEGRYQLVTYTYLVGRFTRTWQLDPETREPDPIDNWDFGVEFAVNF